MRVFRSVVRLSALLAFARVFTGSGILTIGGLLLLASSTGFADTLKSNNYQFTEQALGGIGQIGSQSTNYQGIQASGAEFGLGTSASPSFQIQAGNSTTSDPALAFEVNTPTVSFGSFSAAAATTATSTFQVADYTSYGYIVQMFGTPPTNGTHTITALSSAGVSQAGVEQFGVNLVANTSPVSLGANPDHGQFGVGSAATNYNTSNNYRFVSGDTVATAPKSSGLTTYTVSYIVNVSSLTPGGNYTGNQLFICTGTY